MNDRLTNAEKPTRYTAVFEFEGQPPAVHVACGWLGGRLVAVSFEDELARIDFADALLAAAGEKEPGDCCKAAVADIEARADNVEAEMRDMIRDRDAQIDGLESDIAALKRRLDPIQSDEARIVATKCPQLPLSGHVVSAIVTAADLIRARRA